MIISTPMKTKSQAILIFAMVGFSWLAMQVVHETGHVLHAWVSGATIRQVVLHPLEMSRTELRINPHPQFVAWGGVIWGCVLPIALVAVSRRLKLLVHHLVRFFAGFCLVANGAYFIVGSIDLGADPGDLVRFGAPLWSVVTTGVLAAAVGFRVWNGLGPQFGLGKAGSDVRPGLAMVATVSLIVLVAIELVLQGRLQVLE